MMVEELFGKLGIRLDQASWDRANSALGSLGKSLGNVMSRTQAWGRSLSGMAVKLAAGFGVTKAIETGLKFNATVEETKNQIAGMLALAKKTDLNDQLGVADQLFANLQKRAASLPGTTQEYANMLSQLAQPLTDAGLGLKDLEDITVNSVVGAKAFKIEWEAAARDVAQAVRGQFHANDQFTGIILGSVGFKGEEGRQRFNELSAKRRGEVIKQALLQKQLTQLAAAQGQTASGKWSTFIDTAQQTLGRVMAPLFAKLVAYLEQVNKWLDANDGKVKAFAKDVGGVLVTGLEALIEALKFLSENKGLAIALGIVIGALLLMSSPIAMIVAGVTVLVLVIKKLGPVFEAIRDAAIRAFGGIEGAIDSVGDTVNDVADAIASPFVAAWDAVRSAFESVYNWIREKLAWVEGKIDWVVDKAKAIGGVVGSALGGPAGNATAITNTIARVPSIAPATAGPTTVTNTINVGDVNVDASGVKDAQSVGDIVQAHVRQVMSDAHASLRGGRR